MKNLPMAASCCVLGWPDRCDGFGWVFWLFPGLVACVGRGRALLQVGKTSQHLPENSLEKQGNPACGGRQITNRNTQTFAERNERPCGAQWGEFCFPKIPILFLGPPGLSREKWWHMEQGGAAGTSQTAALTASGVLCVRPTCASSVRGGLRFAAQGVIQTQGKGCGRGGEGFALQRFVRISPAGWMCEARELTASRQR